MREATMTVKVTVEYFGLNSMKEDAGITETFDMRRIEKDPGLLFDTAIHFKGLIEKWQKERHECKPGKQ